MNMNSRGIMMSRGRQPDMVLTPFSFMSLLRSWFMRLGSF